jgi:acyl carrier protein
VTGQEGSVMAYLLQHLLNQAAARAPQRPAVASGDGLLSYQELDQLSNKVARALLPLANDISLLETSILDSMSLLRVVVFLEERFRTTAGEGDLPPENFASVNTNCAYLRAREPAKWEATHG